MGFGATRETRTAGGDHPDMNTSLITLHGHCHCQAVRFECDTPQVVSVLECNCSICSLTGYLHLIVPKARFRLLQGQASLTEYRFNTQQAQHWFCKVCGIKTFYVPRSHPDCVSVHLNAVDASRLTVTRVPFDGRQWEAAKARLSGSVGE